MQKSRRIKHILRTAFLLGAAFCYSATGYAAIDVNTLPTGGQIAAGNGLIHSIGNIMNIVELDNTIIKWQDFSIGKNAEVSFDGEKNFNVLNYVASGGSMSQIYGTMEAYNDGNVYLVNPAGVFIGDGANVNVGSLYVSNKKIDALDKWQEGDAKLTTTVADMMAEASAPQTAAQLMSLGNITANKVFFEGDRIVLDMDKLKNRASTDTPDLEFYTDNTDNIVLGYTAYTDNSETYAGKAQSFTVTTVGSDNNVNSNASIDGYMWVEDGEQLQALNTNKSGNYALRNDIDLAASNIGNFTPIGDVNNRFTGKLDGLGHSVSNLKINRTNRGYTGLFGVTKDATLRNLTLASGSVESSWNYSTGGLVGYAQGGVIENIINNGVNVSGKSSTGGIVGDNIGASLSGTLANSATVQAATSDNTGVGGVIGVNDGADISGATLINSGVVVNSGYACTGGVIGYNYNSNISQSSLIATESSVVIGKEDVGGLIGDNNQGTVEGGRDANDNYYAYQIYNSGLVIGGNYKPSLALDDDEDSWTELGDGRGCYQLSETSNSIGGLIGYNERTSSLSAAYNTGSVLGGTYVGGIVGYNRGSIDQVFNAASIQGKDNVDGIVGYDRGSIKQVSDISAGSDNLLDIFLTKVEFIAYEGFEKETFVYDALEHGDYSVDEAGIVYRNNEAIGCLQDVDANAPHSLQSYLANYTGELLLGTRAKDSDDHDILTSKQIDSKGHLGFKIVSGDGSHQFTIDKATLVITPDTVYRTYGDSTITKQVQKADGYHAIDDSYGYGFTIDVAGQKMTEELEADIKNIIDNNALFYGAYPTNDGAIVDRNTGKTNGVGEHQWTLMVNNLMDGWLYGKYTKNFTLSTSSVGELKGVSIIEPANLTINVGWLNNDKLDDIVMTYGDSEDLYKDKYSYAASEEDGKKLVNGDELADVIKGMTYNNTGFAQDGKTQDAGNSYKLQGAVSEQGAAYGNYKITLEAGNVTINPKTLTVSLNGVSRVYGDKNLSVGSEYGFVIDGWAYDENYKDALELGAIQDTALKNVDGAPDANGRVTDNVGESYTWSGTVSGLNSDALKNYTVDGVDANGIVSLTGGKSVVTQANLTVNIGELKADGTLGSVEMIYGDSEDLYKDKYSYAASTTDGEKLVNGDKLADVIAGMAYNNTGFAQDGKTQDAGDNYELTYNSYALGSAYNNYNVRVNAGKVTIAKKELSVSLNDVSRVYGDKNLSVGSEYGFVIDGWAYDENYKDALELGAIQDTALKNVDGAPDANGRVTDNVGESYTWSGTVSGLNSDALKNYTIAGADTTGTAVVTGGKSVVTQANLTVNIGDVEMTYGDKEEDITYSYAASEEYGKKLVNGDELADVIKGMTYTNTGFQNGKTQDVGNSYKLQGAVSEQGASYGNYKITLEAGNVTINPKTLTVSLNGVSRVYGNSALSAGSEYGFVVEGWAYDVDKQLAKNLQLQNVSDGALTGAASGKVTNDASKNGESYTWSGTVSGLNSDALKNYTVDGVDANGIVSLAGGKSVVTQANLTVNIGDVEMTYGDKEEDITYSYAASEADGKKLVNGDELADVIESMTYNNTGFTQNGKTQDAGGDYSVSQDAVTPGAAYGNYRISFTAGDVTINPKTLTVTLQDISRVYGDLSAKNYSGLSNIEDLLVNGDTLVSTDAKVEAESDGALTDSNTHTKNVGDYSWTASVSGNEAFNNNYKVTVGEGKSSVTSAHITIAIDSKEMYAGNSEPSYSGTISGITNGDSASGLFGDYSYGLEDSAVVTTVGEHKNAIGIFIGGQYYNFADNFAEKFSSNYTYEILPGTLVVTQVSQGADAHNPDWWQAEDKYPWYQWDKRRTAREREAELQIVDGGMQFD